MTPPKKQPSNAELMQQLTAIRQEYKDMQANMAALNTRVFTLETDKVAKDAVADYLVRHPAQTVSESKLNKDLVKYIGVALGIIATLLTLMQGARP